jgi:hypothetical protein
MSRYLPHAISTMMFSWRDEAKQWVGLAETEHSEAPDEYPALDRPNLETL